MGTILVLFRAVFTNTMVEQEWYGRIDSTSDLIVPQEIKNALIAYHDQGR